MTDLYKLTICALN